MGRFRLMNLLKHLHKIEDLSQLQLLIQMVYTYHASLNNIHKTGCHKGLFS